MTTVQMWSTVKLAYVKHQIRLTELKKTIFSYKGFILKWLLLSKQRLYMKRYFEKNPKTTSIKKI